NAFRSNRTGCPRAGRRRSVMEEHFAIPFRALLDEKKLQLHDELPIALAEHLQAYLADQLNIRCMDIKVLRLGNNLYLRLIAVEKSSIPALCALADVQKVTLYRYERADEGRVTLTPLMVAPDA